MTSRDAEQLGILLNQPPYTGQTEDIRRFLSNFEPNILPRLINSRIRRYTGQTPVHLAATNGLIECLEILLKSGGDPNVHSSPTDLCQTPLHLAARKGYVKSLQLLLEYGARFDVENTHRETPMQLARGKKNCERVFEHAINKYQIPLRTKEEEAIVEELHTCVDDNLERFYFLYGQLSSDRQDLATRWTDFFEQTLLYRATVSEQYDAVKYLLSRSSNQPLHNLNTFDTPLLVACLKRNHRIVQLLLNHSPRLLFLQDARNKRSALHIACSNCDIEMLDMLLSYIKYNLRHSDIDENNKFSLDFLDILNRTPLFNACYYSFLEGVKRLLEFQNEHKRLVLLDVNAAVVATRRTPLHVAVRRGKVEIIQLLLDTKRVDISLEARPSKDTHKRLLHHVQKKLHGRVIPMQESVDNSQDDDDKSPNSVSSSSTGNPVSPTSWTTISTPNSSVFDGDIPNSGPNSSNPSSQKAAFRKISGDRRFTGIPENREAMMSPDERFAFTISPKKTRTTTEVVKKTADEAQPAKKRSTTSADELGETGAIAVYETLFGRLEILPKGSKGTIFDDIYMTALAEACVYGRTNVVSLLLKHGARDEDGFACRICHITQNPWLEQLILSYHCSLGVIKTDHRRKQASGVTGSGGKLPHGLELHWSSKKLPACDGEWLNNRVTFLPERNDTDDDVADTGYGTRQHYDYGRKASIVHVPVVSQVDFTAVKAVNLDHNFLKEVPIELFCLPKVIKIDLSHNQIVKLPEAEDCYESLESTALCGWECGELEELNLSHNQLSKLPSCVWVLPNLKTLYGQNNSITTLLPDDRGFDFHSVLSKSMTKINFSHNKLDIIPRFVFELPNLRTVLFQYNMLQSIPETVWTCVSLQDLDVSHNKITSLPWCEEERTMIDSRQEYGPGALIKKSDKIMVGKSQVRPQFQRNSSFFQRHPSIVGTIEPLTNSQGEPSQNFTIPTNPVEGCDYSSLTKLVLSHNQLKIFPEALPCLAPNLQELDVSDNEFKYIDLQFIPQSTKKFTARRCKIARFGNVLLKEMWSQVVRNCRHGKTFGMPCQHRSHHNLPCLLKLDLLGNDLSHFQLIHHPPLESEHKDPAAEEKRYRHGVASLDLLYPLLEGLDLGKNKLEGEFNPNIGYQSHLKSINLSKNHSLEKLPMEFAHLKNSRLFTELSRDDCPNLVEPPKEYQNVSLTHLLAYMRSRLKESVSYRTIKLFFIGNGERGKTTLLRRLRALPNEAIKNPERTTGIDIEEWVYPPRRTGTLGRSQSSKNPVQFLAWDFAGQDIYHTTHQCFYSRRSLYLALFRLKDGIDGVNELEPWLRNVQLRAPGCPVIIVGTHLDAVSAQEAKELEDEVKRKYSNPTIYPKIVATATISSTKRGFFSNHMENLRNHIYDIACHLQLTSDGHLEYKPDMKEDDPKALFSQQIPKSFLDLQQNIRKLLVEYSEKQLPPILEEETFRKAFRKNFEDDEEMTEAVYCLNLQGTLLHFEDHGLKNIYFLDPQWLAKLMADVIRPAAVEEGSPIQNGVADVSALFSQRNIPESLRDKYISLLEKFEVALTIKRRHVIIPSLMPDSAQYPKTTDVLRDWTEASMSTIEACYQPPLRRFWMSNYIPDGFWPRLICRIANDQQIGKVLRTVIGDSPHHTSFLFDSASYDDTDNFQDKDILSWIPWKMGITFAHRGRTLLVLKQESNKNCPEFLSRWEFSINLLKEVYRIEIHVYTDEWIRLVNELSEAGRLDVHLTPTNVTAYATRLLVMVSGHIKSLASNWFPGMLESPQGMSFVTFMPCWKCYAEIGFGSLKRLTSKKSLPGYFICKEMNPVHCFILEENIVPAALGEDLKCPIHSAVKCVQMVPDLTFWDLTSLYEEGSNGSLHIIENEFLGKGGFGFVCKGELRQEHGGPSKNVAVKIFLQEMDNLDNHSISELLLLSKQSKHLLHAYKEIRQEVSFLATLNNPFLTELCGVRTTPYMCLLLELAPKKSLRSMLKEYKECGFTLEPLTLKNTALQIAKGLEYLHQHQVVHLDVKSPNVLVWYFPSAHDSRSLRVRQAGNVWIKIADYGISQVSTGLTLRVGTSPVGTPGFMAPELFDKVGQEISSEKVDVFAYGMTLYELLSFRSPFDNIPLVKRNFEIREKQRPALQARETRSLVLFQDLMSLCWSQEPEERPNMSQVREWVESPEFERLRTEVDLRDVKSISCACVCRILPENEEEYIAANQQDRSNITSIFAIPESFDEGDADDFYDGPSYGTNGFDDSPPGLASIHIPSDGGMFFPPKRHGTATCMLVTPSEDKLCIETDRGEKIQDEDDNIYQFVAPRGVSGGRKSAVVEDRGGDVQMQYEFDPYTQIWLCGRDQRKGLLQIFTYNDNNVGQYSFSGYCSKDEVTAICPIRNMIWMGTSTGTIMVFHAPTLKTKFAGKLTGMASNPEGSLSGRVILDIRHIPETSSVLIAKVNGEIWSLRDKISRGGLRIEDQILLPEYSPCYHMVKVKVEGSIEVWGTMENNRVLLLERQQYGWSRKELVADPEDHRLRLCSYIVHTSFTGRDGSELSHVWISYRNRSVLVSFDAKARKQRCILNCADQLRTKEDVTFQVATLIASGRKILVGTTSGVVGIFDSETRSLLNALHWHKDKVRTLLVMPKEMEPCICSEMPFPDKEEDSIHSSGVATPSTGSEKSSPFHGKTTRILTQLQPEPKPRSNIQRGMSVFSYLDNRFRIHNPEPEAVMITSVGNGRRRYHVHEQTRAERLRIFENAQLTRSHRSSDHGHDGLRSKYGDDIVLLTWRS